MTRHTHRSHSHALAALSLATGLAGCVNTELTSGGSAVRLTMNPAVVSGCRYVGMVGGADWMNGGWAGQSAAEENATRRILNAAADMGADTVMLATRSVGSSGATLRGEGYACGAPKAP